MATPEHMAGAAGEAAQIRKSTPHLGAVRRWWIILSLPKHDSDLTPEEWQALHQRYLDAGGITEDFEDYIERDVLE